MERTTKYHMKTSGDYEDGSGIPPSWTQLGVAYVATSTTHGVPHSHTARGKCKTFFWVLCLLAGMTALGVNMYYLVSKYMQFLPSTRITIYNNRTLPFPAVTICNTNPIKSSAVAQDARLVALLESWGVIEVSGNTTRRKRSVVERASVEIKKTGYDDTKSASHHISKRSESECSFIKVFDRSDGLAVRCQPAMGINEKTQDSCLQEACNIATGGQDEYNAVNIIENTSCWLRACVLPFTNATLMLATKFNGRDIFVRAFNECLSDPCVHGTCEDTDLHYSCTCDTGYTGFNCDTAITLCDSEPCQNGGTCQGSMTSYNCTCPEGYYSIDCSLVTSGYNQYNDTTCTGEDFLPSDTLTVTECETLCDETIGCIAFRYFNATGVCSLRAQCLTTVGESGTTAFIKYVPTEGYSAYVDVDCYGNDIKSVAKPSALDCSRECDEIVTCVGFIYTTSNYCHIKFLCETSSFTPLNNVVLYIKTGNAEACSIPRARIPCPGSFPGITQAECQSLPDCCYDNSQVDVNWCYLDTLYDVHHNHIHTVFRAAQKVPGSPVLYDLWTGTTFTPDLESQVSTNYFSREDSETEVYKSAIAECVWDRAVTACIMVYSDAEEKMYFAFNASGQDKESWYSPSQIIRSSYTDLSTSQTYNYFSIQGDYNSAADINRRWYINHEYSGCNSDNGWYVVIDTDGNPVCSWENIDRPSFLYSALSTKDATLNYLSAESFFIKVKLDDQNLGGSCVSSCLHLSDGSYQSCLGCNVYVVCASQIMTYHVCHKDQKFDKNSQSCQDASTTCTGPNAPATCIPINECDTNTECLNGGTCSMTSTGWECLCTETYSGRYCQNCADGSSKIVVSWTTDDRGKLFTDGVQMEQNTNWRVASHTTLPCSTLMVAFQLQNVGADHGFLASIEDLHWLTGDGILKCTSDSNMAIIDDWKLLAFDDSSWEVAIIVASHGDSPWGNIANINSSAKWVWTSTGDDEIYCRLPLVTIDTTTSLPTTPSQSTTDYCTTEETTTITHEPTTTFVFVSSFPERSPPTEEFLKEEEVLSLLAEIDDETKIKLGYTLNDLVIDCDFDGQLCKESDFSWFFDAIYGNCYIFNSGWEQNTDTTSFESKHQGFQHGLTIVLNIGQYEYIPDVGEAAGAVVVVHDSDDMPFPEDEGILALPGKLTSVGIKKIDIHRLPEPHGECQKNIERNITRSLFEEHYPVKYSIASCYRTCYQKYVVETCGCGDPQYPIQGQVFGGKQVVPCNARNMTQDDCKYSVTKRYINDELGCDCPNPCQQDSYEYKVSSADWPTAVDEASVFNSMRYRLATAGVTGLSDSQIKRNMVKIQVFYETHSYERLVEYPSYKLAKLFWDIGGILGLWLGCSVLSIVELIELAMDALVLLCYKLTKKQYWAMPVKKRSSNKASHTFDDLTNDKLVESDTAKRTNKKVKVTIDGRLLYTSASYSHGKTGLGHKITNGVELPNSVNNRDSNAFNRKMTIPGIMLGKLTSRNQDPLW